MNSAELEAQAIAEALAAADAQEKAAAAAALEQEEREDAAELAEAGDRTFFSPAQYDHAPVQGAKYTVVILGTKRIKEAKGKPSYTTYKLRVTDDNGDVWITLRRYRELRSLMETLKETYDRSKVPHKFPGKKLLGNMDPQNIDHRHMQLQTWLNKVLAHPELGRSPEVVLFLEELKLDPSQFLDTVEEDNTDLQVRLALGKMGYLHKLHHGKWKKGWFVLRNEVLYKYRSHTDKRSYGQYSWDGCNVTEVELPGGGLRLYCFMVTTPENKKYVFATEEEDECEEWIEAIQSAVAVAAAGSSS